MVWRDIDPVDKLYNHVGHLFDHCRSENNSICCQSYIILDTDDHTEFIALSLIEQAYSTRMVKSKKIPDDPALSMTPIWIWCSKSAVMDPGLWMVTDQGAGWGVPLW